jgi:hypothetical protein
MYVCDTKNKYIGIINKEEYTLKSIIVVNKRYVDI